MGISYRRRKKQYIYCMFCSHDFLLKKPAEDPSCPKCGTKIGVLINDRQSE